MKNEEQNLNEAQTGNSIKADVMGSIKCESCGKNEATYEHPCPFVEEIHGDSESMCNCCDDCCHQCAMYI